MKNLHPLRLEYVEGTAYDFTFASAAGDLKFRFLLCEPEAGLRAIQKIDPKFSEMTFDDVARDLIVSAVLAFDEHRQSSEHPPSSLTYTGQDPDLAHIYKVGFDSPSQESFVAVIISGSKCILKFEDRKYDVAAGPRAISYLTNKSSPARSLLQSILHFDESCYYRASASDEVYKVDMQRR